MAKHAATLGRNQNVWFSTRDQPGVTEYGSGGLLAPPA